MNVDCDSNSSDSAVIVVGVGGVKDNGNATRGLKVMLSIDK